MANGHGGKRAGAGRQSNNELVAFRALIDQAVSERDWLEILRAAKKEAKTDGKGAALARDWLSRNRFGLPTQVIAGDPDAPPIQFIEVARHDGASPIAARRRVKDAPLTARKEKEE